jgi:hypothetical protein
MPLRIFFLSCIFLWTEALTAQDQNDLVDYSQLSPSLGIGIKYHEKTSGHFKAITYEVVLKDNDARTTIDAYIARTSAISIRSPFVLLGAAFLNEKIFYLSYDENDVVYLSKLTPKSGGYEIEKPVFVTDKYPLLYGATIKWRNNRLALELHDLNSENITLVENGKGQFVRSVFAPLSLQLPYAGQDATADP